MTAPTDLVVVLPGNPGQHPAPGRPPGLGAVGRVSAARDRHVRRLAPAPASCPHGIGDEHRVTASSRPALMPDLHVLPGHLDPGQGLRHAAGPAALARLPRTSPYPAAPPGNLLPVGYDWRLSCRYNGQRLGTIIEPALERWRDQGGPYADAQVDVRLPLHGRAGRPLVHRTAAAGRRSPASSSRWAPPTAARPAPSASSSTAPAPGSGRSGIDLTRFARSMPSLHQLLPEYACIEQGGDLAKTTEVTLPELDTAMVADAMRFHTDLRDAEASRPRQPGRHPRHRRHHPADRHHRVGWPAAASSCSTPTRARTWPGTPPCRSSAPAGPTFPWTATRCAASPTSTATCSATPPPSMSSKAS